MWLSGKKGFLLVRWLRLYLNKDCPRFGVRNETDNALWCCSVAIVLLLTGLYRQGSKRIRRTQNNRTQKEMTCNGGRSEGAQQRSEGEELETSKGDYDALVRTRNHRSLAQL